MRFKKANVGFRVLAGGGVKRGGGGDDGGVDRSSSSSSSSCVISENMTELRRDGLDAVAAVMAMDDSRMAYRRLDSASYESSAASTRRFFEAWKVSSS